MTINSMSNDVLSNIIKTPRQNLKRYSVNNKILFKIESASENLKLHNIVQRKKFKKQLNFS